MPADTLNLRRAKFQELERGTSSRRCVNCEDSGDEENLEQGGSNGFSRTKSLTDDDPDELKGCFGCSLLLSHACPWSKKKKKNQVFLQGYVETGDEENLETGGSNGFSRTKSLTDNDLDELKGCFGCWVRDSWMSSLRLLHLLLRPALLHQFRLPTGGSLTLVCKAASFFIFYGQKF
ncbi:hypothetical protein NE237_010804 [Protea cynaroides]|uniref:Uncharacterized protein n=1 Tax=Protea cynaroides TaxID=273540 RepID=A0A9Q0R1X2_9MAGN|nr:hypothetical protein NE237_010804 [Protea cynaroides]